MNTLITGASSGIGEALALECARRLDRLFLCGRDAARLEDVARRCRAMDAPTYATVVDVTDREAMRAWIHSCEAIAPVERVFANAGVGTGIEDERNVRRTFDTNVGGTLNTVLPAIDLFRSRRGGGQIVITASIAGYGPLKSCPAYSATKSCIKTWGLALRGMLAPEGIRVSVVCPGFVRSRITDRNVGLIAFPWQMRFASWALSVLPFRLNEFINGLLPAKVSPNRDKAL